MLLRFYFKSYKLKHPLTFFFSFLRLNEYLLICYDLQFGENVGFFPWCDFDYLQGFLQYLLGREKGKLPLGIPVFMLAHA